MRRHTFFIVDAMTASCYTVETLNFASMNDESVNQPPGGHSDLRILATCPMCQSGYHPLKTGVIAEREDEHLLFLECRTCGSAVVAIVSAGQKTLQTISVLTDLTRHELALSARDNSISDDDVLELVSWLQLNESIQLTLRREKENF